MANLDSVLKNKDTILQTNVCVVNYRCERWTIKKAQCQRIDALELCWRRLENPLDSKEIEPVSSEKINP